MTLLKKHSLIIYVLNNRELFDSLFCVNTHTHTHKFLCELDATGRYTLRAVILCGYFCKYIAVPVGEMFRKYIELRNFIELQKKVNSIFCNASIY